MNKEPKFAVGGSDPDLAKAKEALGAYLIADLNKLRRHLAFLYDELLPYLKNPKNYSADGTRLLARPLGSFRAKLRRRLPEVLRKIDSEIRYGVRRSVSFAVDSQAGSLKKKGLHRLERNDVDLVKEEAILGLGRDFPRGSGVTYERRLARIEQHHTRQIERIVGSTHTEKAIERIPSEFKSAVLYSKPGPTPVFGGSLAKKIMRLSAAEEMRLVSEAETNLFLRSGILFAYWRLSPSHKWQGGNGVCEIMASQEVSEVTSMVRQRDSSLLTEGLYLIDNWPPYPHPFCRCFAEAAM